MLEALKKSFIFVDLIVREASKQGFSTLENEAQRFILFRSECFRP